MKTPILFIIFNRPETTQKVFEAIRKYKPSKLFVAADGPRESKPGEKERCGEARKITEKIDWPCDVKRLYREKNLGCKMAVSGAITWFFKNVEEGIILEDDCLPNRSFFDFCGKMLNLYRNDTKVMCISGDNFLPKSMQNKNGYYFSKYVHIWGWATWRRVWKNYDVDMESWPKVKKTGLLNTYFENFLEKAYWQTLFDATYQSKVDTWDYQLVYHIWKNSGISVVPGKNLISNIGFGKAAAHLKSKESPLSGLGTSMINQKIKKMEVKMSGSADIYERKNIFAINPINTIKQKLYYALIK